MILTTAALLATAAALATVENQSSDGLLACAADRYRAAGQAAPIKSAIDITANKGMGAIMPARRHRDHAARLTREGDVFRAQATSDLTRREIVARYSDRPCVAG